MIKVKPLQFLALSLLSLSLNCHVFAKASNKVIWRADFWCAIKQDYKEYYSFQGLSHLGFAIGAAGIFANTALDENTNQYWQRHIRSHRTNKIADSVDSFTQLRQIRVVIPTYLAAIALNQTLDAQWTRPLGKWGEHSLRILILAAPQQALLTEALGAHRPRFGRSNWGFFKGNRGVSGHAFYGAVPLISAAATSDSWQAKTIFYTLSTLPALSRVNTDKHYFSQAALGWGLAFMASQAIMKSDQKLISPVKYKLSFQPMNGGWLMGGQMEF